MHERPAAALALSAVGLAFQALGGLMAVYAASYSNGYFWNGMMGPWMMFGGPWISGFYSNWFPFFAILAGVVIVLGLFGVLWMNTTFLSRVRTGSILVLIAAVIAFPTMFGFMIGSLLMLIGSVLGLTWQPRT